MTIVNIIDAYVEDVLNGVRERMGLPPMTGKQLRDADKRRRRWQKLRKHIDVCAYTGETVTHYTSVRHWSYATIITPGQAHYVRCYYKKAGVK